MNPARTTAPTPPSGRRADDRRDRRHGNDAGDAQVLTSPIGWSPQLCRRQCDLVERFLASQAQEVAQGLRARATWEAYRKNLRIWLRFCDADAATDAPTTSTVRAFAQHVAAGRRLSSLNALLDAVRACYAWAASHRLYAAIGASVTWVPYDRTAPVPVLTPDQVASLIEQVPDTGIRAVRDRAMLHLLVDLGLATISLHRLDWGHLHLPERSVGAGPLGSSGHLDHQPQGHRRADVRIRLPPRVCQALQRYLSERGTCRPSDPVFVRISRAGRPGRRLSTLSMRLTVLRLMERAGYARRDATGRLLQPGAYSSSCLRRTTQAISPAAARPSSDRSGSAGRPDRGRSPRRR